MLVFWDENLVFLAVPKTGSTALSNALAPRAAMVLRDPPSIKHSPVYRYRRFLKPYFKQAGGKDPEAMAVVREPISWLSSWYRYRHRETLAGHPNSTIGISFDDFCLEYMKGKRRDFANLGSQSKFLLTGDNELGVTHLFKYEDQPRLISFLEARLNHKIELPQANVSPQMNLELSEEVEERLRRKCALEFAVWEMGAA
ncbi:sulfotransferase family 2 domain-containing protein [Thalassobium sp. R2A62]|jgi:hypothetical protein|uniref:sulfotransferase family 2 domain-containing protein n=1 Tax=Thalassobium sp. R2A62 TaxID=633131 RepID=UPI0001B1D1F2|nr:sulfotransferase family 2 domain-containing protein [Thalassobium sp. R2A62]EET48124.1 hypothetical protein TR2A62_0531 [Thalassobium sp. R2A62]MDG1338471.1 sulfotransferase family 2 domain-containing protein [Paracoccaceae bacterium]MDG2453627.1 sulfotransferase family 2 domain-containing protein [Paracoccaceae bacterium]